MANNTGKENTKDEQSHSEEPQFDELSNAELDEVQGAGIDTYLKLGDVDGESGRSSAVNSKGFKVEIEGIKISSKSKFKAT